MPVSLKAVAGDTITKLRVTCKDLANSLAINLVVSTVRLKYKINDGALQTKLMTIVSPATGLVEYQFNASELTEGWFVGEVEITDNSTSRTNTSNKIFMDIEAKV